MGRSGTNGQTQLTDEILFSRYKAGDTVSFNTLLAKHKNQVFAFIFKMVKSQAQAEDIFQETFFKVVERREQFRSDVSFKAWLFTIARNTTIDALRKKKRTLEDLDDEGQMEGISSDANAHDNAVEGELSSFLTEALKKLPPEQRETFVLRVKAELTFEEIGEVMVCSTNTVKSRMRYAMDTLGDYFRKKGILKEIKQ